MERKKAIILGAGISGLSLAWYLQQSNAPIDLVILEKSERAGGWLRTDHSTGFVFEKGPRAFKVSKSATTLKLVQELGMSQEIISSCARARYLWVNQRLQRLPDHLLSWMISPLTRGIIPTLLTEWKKNPRTGDETVWEFVSRRLSPEVARLFFDPLVVGVFGGDSREISVQACFPTLKRWEEEWGSMTRGLWMDLRRKKQRAKFCEAVPELPLSAMYSFSSGMEQLVQNLVKNLDANIQYDAEATSICLQGQQVCVQTNGQEWIADALFCALPIAQAGFLLRSLAPDIAAKWAEIKSRSIATVSAGYTEPVLPCKGFGYLTALQDQEDLLGVVFDSSVFPQHNGHPKETRLTVKLADRGLSREGVIETALQGIKRHLKIEKKPDAISYQLAVNAIPQYGVDHLTRMEQFDARLRAQMPQLYFVGNYWSGVSVDHCIARSKQVAERFCQAR